MRKFSANVLCGVCLLAGCASAVVPAPPPMRRPISNLPAVNPYSPVNYTPSGTPVSPSVPATSSENWGRFYGAVDVELIGGRDARLIHDFSYLDPHGKTWIAPRGSVVNGASIPQFFWSFLGGPWDGNYRQASVLHDVACARMTESWEDSHRMYYEACRCGGVDERTAKLMYWAVYHFGPRWELRPIARQPSGLQVGAETAPAAIATRLPNRPVDETAMRSAMDYFRKNSPALEEIPGLTFSRN